MKKLLMGLALASFICTGMVSGALAQSATVNLPPVQFKFLDLSVSWETKIFELSNSDLAEGRIIRASVAFDPFSAGPQVGDDIFVQFEGGGTSQGLSPCLVIRVPGESVSILPNKNFRIFSTDPKLNGVKNLWTDAVTGEVIEDVTGGMTFFDLRLTLRNGLWVLDIELEKSSPDLQRDWVYPGGSVGTTVVIGNSSGTARPQKVEMVHVMD